MKSALLAILAATIALGSSGVAGAADRPEGQPASKRSFGYVAVFWRTKGDVLVDKPFVAPGIYESEADCQKGADFLAGAAEKTPAGRPQFDCKGVLH